MTTMNRMGARLGWRATGLLTGLLAGTALAGCLFAANPAAAQSAAQLGAIQGQISTLQAQLRRLQAEAAGRDAAVRAARDEANQARVDANKAMAQAAVAPQGGLGNSVQLNPNGIGPAASLAGSSPQSIVGTAVDKPNPTFRLGNVSITLGGFVDLDGIFRSRNETAGVGSSLNGIPFRNNQNAHTGEFRETAQQSRFSMLVQGKVSDTQAIAGYAELDLNASGTSSNSNQTNSYVPRVRHLYATYDDSRYGVHLLTGQTWSFLTPETVGMTPRKEQVPLTIDTSYVPGFTYTRAPQLRLAKDFGGKYWVGVSFESPQELYSYQTASGAVLPDKATILYNNPGSVNLNSATAYSVDVAPDMIVKVAADPGYGHYEAYGLGRFFKSRVSTLGAGKDQVAFGGGIGGSVTLPLVPKLVDFTGNILAGSGIGKYGASQLPDASFKANGSPAPLPEVIGLVGLIGHPTPAFDVYGYLGTEQIGRETNGLKGTGPGYGGSNVVNTQCNIELGTACGAQTRSVTGGAVGAWWRFLHGNYGTMMAGAQYGYDQRIAFHGVGGKPSTDESIVMFTLRYLPFQ